MTPPAAITRRARPRRPTAASTSSSSASASPAPASPSTPPPAACRVLAVDAHDLAFGTSRWCSQARARRAALPRQRPGRRRPRERRRARHPDGGHRPAPDPRAADAAPARPPTSAAARPRCTRAGLRRRRPAPARRPHPARRRCPGRAGSPRTETARARARPARRRAPRRRCCRWDGQLEDDARLVVDVARTAAAHGAARPHPRPGRSSSTGTGAVLRDELTGDDRDRRAPGRSSTPPASGPAAWSTTSGCGPSRGTHLVLRADDASRACASR